MNHNKLVYKYYFLVFLLVICSGSVFSQAKKQLSEVGEPQLQTANLQNEQLIKNIFLGKFLDIPFDRDKLKFSILLDVYVTAYAKYCGANLPTNKIELTRQECATEEITKNVYGLEIARKCISWVTVGTGIYASPKMYQAKNEIDNLQTGDVFRNLFKILSQENPVGATSNIVQDGLVMKQDIAALFTKNDCNSQGLKRFEENLRLFALNKQPVVLVGNPTGNSNLDILSKNQNFEKLIDDLIYEQSTKWAMNRYNKQSITSVSVTSRDNYNRPVEIKANYRYQSGFGGETTGSVRLTFTDGLPECLYFFDFPTTCRTPDRKIVAKYADGSYQK